MPCYDAPTDHQKMIDEKNHGVLSFIEHNSKPAELLCFVMGCLEANGLELKQNPKNSEYNEMLSTLNYWWDKHKERDRQR